MKTKTLFAGAALALLALVAQTTPSLAKGGHGSHSSGSHSSSFHSYSSHSYSSPGYHHTHSYTTKRGTYVGGHYGTNADGHFGNNWSTKGNTNPMTGKSGSRVTPPHHEKW